MYGRSAANAAIPAGAVTAAVRYTVQQECSTRSNTCRSGDGSISAVHGTAGVQYTQQELSRQQQWWYNVQQDRRSFSRSDGSTRILYCRNVPYCAANGAQALVWLFVCMPMWIHCPWLGPGMV